MFFFSSKINSCSSPLPLRRPSGAQVHRRWQQHRHRRLRHEQRDRKAPWEIRKHCHCIFFQINHKKVSFAETPKQELVIKAKK